MSHDLRPRITPLALDDADPATRDLLARLTTVRGSDTRLLNVFGTIAHNPRLLARWLEFTTYLLTESTLAPRLRELVVLRVGWLCRSPYEWGQHVHVGRRAGVTDADLQRLTQGPQAAGWTAAERAALAATDQLVERRTLDDAHWDALRAAGYSVPQVLDFVFLVGQYVLVSTALNACRVERDDGLDPGSVPFPPAAG